MKNALGERGQITIPKRIRESLGLRPGMQLEILEVDGSVVLRRPGIGEAIDTWSETAENPYGSTDAFLSATRDGDA
ncbi:MAG: AbrB/MazE/SpoVT family DNA-binding domain-containing protein [Spirochaetaceae bacterium]|nr:MAG: AbrB/MazE/SpoVT family DNA-binding domain-containing protein [Spirochaetaceae bacterium]